MSLNKAVENLKFDKRLMDLNVRLGRLTPEENEQQLKALPDLESDSLKVDLEARSNESN